MPLIDAHFGGFFFVFWAVNFLNWRFFIVCISQSSIGLTEPTAFAHSGYGQSGSKSNQTLFL